MCCLPFRSSWKACTSPTRSTNRQDDKLISWLVSSTSSLVWVVESKKKTDFPLDYVFVKKARVHSALCTYPRRVFRRSHWAQWGGLRCRWSPERVRGQDHQARWYHCSSLPPAVAQQAARHLVGSLHTLLLGGQTGEKKIIVINNQ